MIWGCRSSIIWEAKGELVRHFRRMYIVERL